MCSLLCNFNCYCTLGASLMLALSAIDVSLHYYYMQNFHRKKKKKKKKKKNARCPEKYGIYEARRAIIVEENEETDWKCRVGISLCSKAAADQAAS